jgi:hypothetical protein
MIDPEHRAGLTEGWKHMLEVVKSDFPRAARVTRSKDFFERGLGGSGGFTRI